jgi:hypothetical protein
MSFRLHCLDDTSKTAKTEGSVPVANANPANPANAEGSGLAKLAELALAAACPPSSEAPAEAATSNTDEATTAREARQAKVEAVLLAHPEQQRAFDVVDAPLKAGPGEPISVVLAVRNGDQIISGELAIPRERWDLKAFLALMDPPVRQQ